ncbi:MAG: hypothetical protein JOZ19_06505 [Rubrobacter sp.]|nr:hypothetical protein [Rubrobacter sp.]
MRESTLNKAFLLAFADHLRYTFGQRQNTLNFRKIIDEGISLIVNLNLSGLDDETQSLIGSFLAIGFANAAFDKP